MKQMPVVWHLYWVFHQYVPFYGKSHKKHLQGIKPCLPQKSQYSIQAGDVVVSSCSGSEFPNISLTLVGGKAGQVW